MGCSLLSGRLRQDGRRPAGWLAGAASHRRSGGRGGAPGRIPGATPASAGQRIVRCAGVSRIPAGLRAGRGGARGQAAGHGRRAAGLCAASSRPGTVFLSIAAGKTIAYFDGPAGGRRRHRARHAQHAGRGRPRHDRGRAPTPPSRPTQRRLCETLMAAVGAGRLGRGRGADPRRHRRFGRRAGLCLPADRGAGRGRGRSRACRRACDDARARHRRRQRRAGGAARPSLPRCCART